jgi:NAD(P)-dependent dehydrogenase (short-subunit alcohol dehydrogenase family)
MGTKPNPQFEENRLQDNVILIINGLCESGRTLARVLSQQGADVAIADSVQIPDLILPIRQDVEGNGRRCLLLTPDLLLTNEKKAFSQQVIEQIMETFGRLDAFVTYSAADSMAGLTSQPKHNGDTPRLALFDQHGLTKAAIKQIIGQ